VNVFSTLKGSTDSILPRISTRAVRFPSDILLT
jgi:hypothetical protein